ncbi:MAG: hypothetical protein RRY79_03360 [Clostridia bacterium]
MPIYTKPPSIQKPRGEVESPAEILSQRILREQGAMQAQLFLGSISPFLPVGEVNAIENRLGIKASPRIPEPQNKKPQNPNFGVGQNSQMQMMQMMMNMMNGKR